MLWNWRRNKLRSVENFADAPDFFFYVELFSYRAHSVQIEIESHLLSFCELAGADLAIHLSREDFTWVFVVEEVGRRFRAIGRSLLV